MGDPADINPSRGEPRGSKYLHSQVVYAPRGSVQYILPLWNLVPQDHNKDGLLGPNSIMVVYEEPLGKYFGPKVLFKVATMRPEYIRYGYLEPLSLVYPLNFPKPLMAPLKENP